MIYYFVFINILPHLFNCLLATRYSKTHYLYSIKNKKTIK